MAHFQIKRGKTAVEALGMVMADSKDIYYMNFAGPSEVVKAVWAHAVGSEKTNSVTSPNWPNGKLTKPNRRTVVKLPTTNNTNCILRCTNPYFLLVRDDRMLDLPAAAQYTGYSDKDLALIETFFPHWTRPTNSYNCHESDVRKWLHEQPVILDEMARRLVNALNLVTQVPIMDDWGRTLLDNLPPQARNTTVKCYGDAVAACLLKADFDYIKWVSGLLKAGKLTIPQPTKE